jgi:hypothetical protein
LITNDVNFPTVAMPHRPQVAAGNQQLLAGSYAGLITAAAMEPNQSLQAVSIERSSDAQRPSNIRKGHLAEARER